MERNNAGDFNGIAPYYDFLLNTVFGDTILRAQICYFDSIKDADVIVIFGGGTGNLLVNLIEEGIGKTIYYVDIADRMLEITRKKVNKQISGKLIQLHFVRGSYENIPKNVQADVIFTPFVFDCFSDTDLDQAIASLTQHLKPEGNWFFSDFQIPDKPLHMKLTGKILVKLMYWFFQIFCRLQVSRLPDFQSAFNRSSLSLQHEQQFLKGLISTRKYQQTRNFPNQLA